MPPFPCYIESIWLREGAAARNQANSYCSRDLSIHSIRVLSDEMVCEIVLECNGVSPFGACQLTKNYKKIKIKQLNELPRGPRSMEVIAER